MRRIFIAFSSALFILAVGASPAAATKPVREPTPDFEFEFAAGEVCSFAIEGTTLVNRGYTTTFFDPNGNPVMQIISGTLIVQVTNLDTGTSVVRNISGPGTITFAPDGGFTLEANGAWLFVTLPGGPSLAYINKGRIVFEFTPDGQINVLMQQGIQEDLCATLG
jgi:hypothetical protein